MLRRTIIRILIFCLTVWVAITVNFIIVRATPVDPIAGILGRMANYSGQEVRWDDAMASNQKLVPEGLVDFSSPAPVMPDAEGRYPVAIPGVTKPFEIWY